MKYYFPKPYKGEFLYSILGRYFAHTGTTLEDFNRHKFNQNTPLHRAPTGSIRTKGINQLRVLLEILDPVQPPTWHYLLKKHYSFDLMAALSTNEIVDWSTEDGYQKFCSIPPSKRLRNLFSPTLRYCKDCINEQLKSAGESYWITDHQYADLNLCSVHDQQLQETTVSSNIGSWLKRVNPDSLYLPHEIKPHQEIESKLSNITRKPQLRMLELITQFNSLIDCLYLTPSVFIEFVFNSHNHSEISTICYTCPNCIEFSKHLPSFDEYQSNKNLGNFGCSEKWNLEFIPFFLYLASETCINAKPLDIYSEMLAISRKLHPRFRHDE